MSDPLIPLDTYLQYVALAIRKYGWTSKTKAYNEGEVPTAEVAYDLMYAPSDLSDCQSDKPSQRDIEVAKNAVEWAKENLLSVPADTLGDYLFNLREACASETIERRNIGLVASLIPTASKAIEKKLERERGSAESQHMGQVGKRGYLALTVLGAHQFPSQWGGSTTLYRLADEDGNVAILFSDKLQMEVGQTYQFQATVRAHEIRDGVAQTILTRAKLIEGSDKREQACIA